MIRSIVSFLGALTLAAVVGVGAIHLARVDLPSASWAQSEASILGDALSGFLAPGQAIGTCCVRCCVEIRINADDTYTLTESDCDTGRICRIVSGVLRPKRQ